jgi:GntR family transcriptional regulator, transcriptional repressor for pyruvate dehydrogenase complex
MDNHLKIDKIKHKTLVEQVMGKIRKLIASGEFKVHDRLPTENEMAEMFGTGRSSIREAIKVFNYLGVLESRAAKGTYVCSRSNISTEALTWSMLLGQDDYYELIDMRAAMELWSMVALAGKYGQDPSMVQNTLDMLESQVSKMRNAIEDVDSAALARADYDFHCVIIDSGDNALFSSIYEILRSFMREEIEKSHKDFTDIKTIIQEHRLFIDAIRSGDIGVAQQTVLNHIASIKRRLANVLNS